MMNKLRKEYELRKERRGRAVKNLVQEAVVNVLAEQQLDNTQAPIQPEPAEQLPPQPPQQQNPEEPAGAEADNQTVPKQYTVDDMIQELNAIRSGRSFTDPEIYGRLVTFFKNLSDEDKASLDNLLTQIAELVTGIEDALDNQMQNVPQGQQNGNAQPQPPVDAPQQAAPLPGAQNTAVPPGHGQT